MDHGTNINTHPQQHQHPPPPPPPPPTGPPPRYTAVVTKVYPYSLRPVVFFTAFIGFIYGIALGVASIKDMGDDFETAKQKVFDIVTAVLYFVIGGIEAYALFVAFVQKIPLARFLVWLVPAGILVNLANQVIAVIIHFTMKNDLIDQCVKNEAGDLGIDRVGNISNITTDQAQTICNNAWDRGTWSVFAWLFLSLIVSLLFGSILMSYYRQLIDPSSVRTRNSQAQNQAFQMQPGYYYPPPPPPNNGSQPWMVPPYPGPPAAGAPPPGGFEKSDYHPDAPWAQGEYSAPHRGPDNDGDIGGANRAEEEAWQRAQSEGVTAHLTGHATSPRQGAGSRDEDRGYVIRNEEEDEAWERARAGGVTAHLTGGHAPDTLSNEGRRREGAI
ncbi:hypothetical protein IAT40_002967 [Kwoniella sp. CBS 6097]